MKRLLSTALILSFLTTLACASNRQVQSGPVTPKPFVTPWEYYQSARTAELKKGDKVKVQNVEQVHSTHSDTPHDKRNIIIIGVLVGVVVIGGTVAGILLTR